jgi:hypothetical protein
MYDQVTKYRFIWKPSDRRGEIAFFTNASKDTTKLPILSPEEFSAIAAIFRTGPVFWNGSYFISGEGFSYHTKDIDQFGPFICETNSNAQRIVDLCEQEWPSNSSNCSGFVIAVTSVLGVTLAGDANDIVNAIRSAEWEQISSGNDAKIAADAGKLVVAGLRGDEQVNPDEHGHVVIIVSGPIANDLYPTAYWGKLGGVGEKFKTINYAWRATDRDRVTYAAKTI